MEEEMSRTAMGSKAALAEAVKRWGASAWLAQKIGIRLVGRGFLGFRVVMGKGKSWMAAFDDADRREGKKETNETREEK